MSAAPPDLAWLRDAVADCDWPAALACASNRYAGHAVFTTSFGLEDQAITHAIASARLPVRIVTLDTGRLFEETHVLHADTHERYAITIEALFPDRTALEALVAAQGPNGFRQSVENRHRCCHVRKVEPLGRALHGAALWITGMRREQSPGRAILESVEWDGDRRLVKYHPLFHQTDRRLRAYIDRHRVPYSPLHDRGYPSIGCAPCTRSVAPGDPARSGRWWWEQDQPKECGLHVRNGRLVRAKGPVE